MVTGDASGRNASAMVKDNLNYYKIIQAKLQLGIQQIKVPSANPRLEDNQVLVNSIFAKYPIKIHKEKAKALIFDLQNVKMLPDGSIDKGDRTDATKQADAIDTLRYWENVFMAGFLQRR